MKILSIQVGKPKTVNYRGKEISTGIFKDPITGPVFLHSSIGGRWASGFKCSWWS